MNERKKEGGGDSIGNRLERSTGEIIQKQCPYYIDLIYMICNLTGKTYLTVTRYNIHPVLLAITPTSLFPSNPHHLLFLHKTSAVATLHIFNTCV